MSGTNVWARSLLSRIRIQPDLTIVGALRKLLSCSISICALILSCDSFAELPPPVPSPRVDTQPEKSHSTKSKDAGHKQQRGTKEHPLIVEILQPPGAATHTEPQSSNSNPHPPEDKTVEKVSGAFSAASAVAVAIFTFFLWRTSSKQWEATSTAAHAALKTADTMTAAERAYVFVNVKPVPQDFSDAIPPKIIANCCNHGKTPAKIRSLQCRPEIVPSIPIRLPPMIEEESPEGLVIASGNIFGATMGATIPDDVIGTIKSGKVFLVCYGVIRYYDIFDEEWETGFCWQYDDGIRRFRISNSPLNYCRKAELNSKN
jgi:hypothetical protein